MQGAHNSRKRKDGDESVSMTALTAVAFQDHLLRSVGHLSLSDPLGSRKLPVHKQKNYKRDVKAVVNTGLSSKGPGLKKIPDREKEYVLDPRPPAPTLAQKLGLVEKPKTLLTEQEWSNVKTKSNDRDDSKDPCVICKEEFGKQEQVLLSCSHVFHRSCLEAFERFSGKKTCPMCRREQYQTRIIHEGARVYRAKCATVIQAQWRGYVVRSWYKKLRETMPPNDPALRKKFYEEKLTSITERMIRSIDFDTNGFLREIDHSLEASRDIFKNFDNMMRFISEDEWEQIQLKAVERGETECPICLTALERGGITSRISPDHPQSHNNANNGHRPTAQSHNNGNNGHRPTASKSEQHTRYSTKQTSASSNQGRTVQDDHRIPPLIKNQKPKLLPKKLTHGKKTSLSSGVNDNGDIGDEKDQALASSNVGDATDKRDLLVKQKVLLSCSHVFHGTCLQAFEELAEGDRRFTCPICRSSYHKRFL